MADSMEAKLRRRAAESCSEATKDNLLESSFRNNAEPLDEYGLGREGEENDQDSANTEPDLTEHPQPKRKVYGRCR